MLRPFLLIGVGGSGGKTLRIVRDELSRRLNQAGWTRDFPNAWQFVHVDIPSHADGNDPDLPAQLPTRDYAGLVAPSLTYRTIDGALAGSGRTKVADSLAGWRPDPAKVNVPIEKGAGQFRALGRMVTIANLQRVKQEIDRAIREMGGADVTGELQDVTRVLGGEAEVKSRTPVAIVVSSIAGGSGAGAVIDVCDALRASGDNWTSESIGILYAPDVFDYLAEERRRGVRPNALATISELLAGFWNKQGPSPETAMLMEKQGVPVGDVDRMGPRYSFLVGSRNEFVSYATQNDIYRAMGRSLASWVSSAQLQDRMEAYTQGNWVSSAVAVPDNLPMKTNEMETPFTALGSARVGLGRDRFRAYASERLAFGAVDRVLRRHEAHRGRDDDRTERALVEDTAQPMFGGFLHSVRLEERSEENNDILEALCPPNRRDRLRALTDQLTAAASENAPEKGRPVADWRELILRRLQDGRPDFLDHCDLEHREQARAWVAAIQQRLVAVTAASIAREGAPVTKELLGKLVAELEQVTIELEQEALKRRRLASEASQYVDGTLREAGGDLIPATHPHIRMAVGRGVQALQWEAEAQVRDLAVRLIPDLVENVLVPLRDAVTRAQQALAREDSTHGDGRSSIIATWPDGAEVPKRLQPAPNEFLLDAVEAYPVAFERVVSRTVGAKVPGSTVRDAIMQVITGSVDIDDPAQQLITCSQAWSPHIPELHTGMNDTASRATFELHLSADEVLDRAENWVSQSSTPIGRYVQEGLRDYLDADKADPEDLDRRLKQFEAQFIAAIDAAQPLVNINKSVLVQVHGRNNIPAECFTTEIPFPARSKGREIVQRVLEAKGLWNAGMETAVSDSRAASIDFFSVLTEPYEPVVFDSLMRPIASEWGVRSKNPDLRQEFWRWRRSRPLTEFIPVAPPIRRAMIRGWFTAALLSQVEMDETHARIFVPSETGGPGRWMPFPDPLLIDDVSAQYEYLPVVLQSLALALVDVSVQASLDPVMPYRRLRSLGEGGGGGWDVYNHPSKSLSQWILDGEVPQGGPTPDPERAGKASDDWARRKTMVEQRFVTLKAGYEQNLFAGVTEREDALDVPLAWELRQDILSAFDDLIRAVRHLEMRASGTDWN